MDHAYKFRRTFFIFIILFSFLYAITSSLPKNDVDTNPKGVEQGILNKDLAITALAGLDIKGRAPKTDYTREQFGGDWLKTNGCDLRNIILNRDMRNVLLDEKCNVVSGVLVDPYSGEVFNFKRGSDTSSLVQIDHVVALSDAWQKGAQQLSREDRIRLANDPIELLAVSGKANQTKSDGDAATWLPSNKSFRCQYVARQIAVKIKYNLWVTQAEYDTIATILSKCPHQTLPNP